MIIIICNNILMLHLYIHDLPLPMFIYEYGYNITH